MNLDSHILKVSGRTYFNEYADSHFHNLLEFQTFAKVCLPLKFKSKKKNTGLKIKLGDPIIIFANIEDSIIKKYPKIFKKGNYCCVSELEIKPDLTSKQINEFQLMLDYEFENFMLEQVYIKR